MLLITVGRVGVAKAKISVSSYLPEILDRNLDTLCLDYPREVSIEDTGTHYALTILGKCPLKT